MSKITQKRKKYFPQIPTEFEFNRVIQKVGRAINEQEKDGMSDYDEFIDNCFLNKETARERNQWDDEEYLERCASGDVGNLAEVIHRKLGVVGGGYIFADKANNQLLSFYNRELQKDMIERLERTISDKDEEKKVPFIEIKYKYYYYDRFFYNNPEKPIEERIKKIDNAKKFRKVLDAFFIEARERQKLEDNNFPEFYRYRYQFKSDREKRKLLPFEKKLNEDGLDIIYCNVGEVLFHLYAWRYLVRLIQHKGRNGTIGMDDKDIPSNIAYNYDFWEIMKTEKELPENYWLNYVNANQDIQASWDALKKIVDEDPLRGENDYSLTDEYGLLGFISQRFNNKDEKASKGFLSLIRYTIHIAAYYLGWNEKGILKSDNITKITKEERALLQLYAVERKLSIFFQEEGVEGEYFKHEVPSLGRLNEDYRISDCIDIVIKSYLFYTAEVKMNRKAKLIDLLKSLHEDSRFPILPYYYEIAASKYHLPKIHMVICVWNSADNEIEVKIRNKVRKTSSVGFVALTLKPIDKTYYKQNFIIGGRSEHCTSFLSEEAFNRIIRLKVLFEQLARPIIDNVFYSALIKKDIEREFFVGYLNSFSHEMSKISDNIFVKSSVPVKKFFKSRTNEFLNAVRPLVKKIAPENFDEEELKNWKIIPNPKIFELWGIMLSVWSGRRHHQIFDLSEKATLKEVMNKCVNYAISLRAGVESQSYQARDSIVAAKKYEQLFKDKKAEIRSKTPILTKYSNDFLADGYQLSDAKVNHTKVIESQNAFLRLLLAAIVNIYEHTTGAYFLEIMEVKGKKTELLFTFINPCEEETESKGPKKSLGTRPVLESCLNILKGQLIHFGMLSNSIGHRIWENELSANNITFERIWITEFKLPYEHIFETH